MYDNASRAAGVVNKPRDRCIATRRQTFGPAPQDKYRGVLGIQAAGKSHEIAGGVPLRLPIAWPVSELSPRARNFR
jgi:hypothetical protein